VKSPEHSHKCPPRIYGQKDIMSHHKPEERSGLTDPPWLIPIFPIVCIQCRHCSCVNTCNRDRDPRVQSSIVNRGRYREWRGRQRGAWKTMAGDILLNAWGVDLTSTLAVKEFRNEVYQVRRRILKWNLSTRLRMGEVSCLNGQRLGRKGQ
jgi:hypothetical protein